MLDVAGSSVGLQLEFLRSLASPEVQEVWRSRSLFAEASEANREPGFGVVEHDVLFAFVAQRRPPRIVQVGAGASTYVMLEAAKFAGYEPEVVCVDPYPTSFLREASRAGSITLIARPAQDVELEVLTGLGDGGMLFVDSTHTVKPGSEVNRIIFEALPRLPAGSWVHFHDILWPYDHRRNVLVDDLFFWNESVLLLAYVTGNPRFSIAISLSMLHYQARDELRAALPRYSPLPDRDGLAPRSGDGHFPSSTYLRVTSAPSPRPS